MSKVIFTNSISLDGFVAGPNDEVDKLFGWYNSGDVEVPLPGTDMKFMVSRASADLFGRTWPNLGAGITGRRNFDHAHAWGGHPPGGGPYFVVTHHVPQEWIYDGSPFVFVTDGVESAVAQAKEAAGDLNVTVDTATTMQQCLKAGLLDEIQLDLVPVLLRDGIRLFEHLGDSLIDLEIIEIVEGKGVTHLRYRVIK